MTRELSRHGTRIDRQQIGAYDSLVKSANPATPGQQSTPRAEMIDKGAQS
jgi:hypothetical protein